MASSSKDASSTDEVPPNLLLNPRAHVLKSSEAPLSTVPSTNTKLESITVNNPSEPLSPEEEKNRIAQCLEEKVVGNKYFAATPPDYELAISHYRSALEACPEHVTEHVSVLHANIAAAFIKLEKWKEAEAAATKSLVSTGEDDEILKERAAKKRMKEQEALQAGKTTPKAVGNSDGRIEEVDDDDDDEEYNKIQWGKNWKARLRRAKAREMVGTWQSLTDGLEDYKVLATRSFNTQPIPAIDRKNIQSAIQRIPPCIEEKKQQEIAEMMGKLKGLGDTILKPFGLSTNNFQMVKDEKTGGYSMNFANNAGK